MTVARSICMLIPAAITSAGGKHSCSETVGALSCVPPPPVPPEARQLAAVAACCDANTVLKSFFMLTTVQLRVFASASAFSAPLV